MNEQAIRNEIRAIGRHCCANEDELEVEMMKLLNKIGLFIEDKAKVKVSDVIDYLNEKTGKKFKATSAATKRVISARTKEGNKLEDFKLVIDIKCEQWLKDQKMAAYLRPETLFGTKMESYLNENFTSKLDPIEGLTGQINKLFDADNVSTENRERIMRGEWPDKPWARDREAMQIAKKIYLIKQTQ